MYLTPFEDCFLNIDISFLYFLGFCFWRAANKSSLWKTFSTKNFWRLEIYQRVFVNRLGFIYKGGRKPNVRLRRSTRRALLTCSSCFCTTPCCSVTCLSCSASSSGNSLPDFFAVLCLADKAFFDFLCAPIFSSRNFCCIWSSCWVSCSHSSYCALWALSERKWVFLLEGLPE